MTSTPRRDTLLPYMKTYDKAFSDAGPVHWSPFTIFYHPINFKSSVINTDSLGFRFSVTASGDRIGTASCLPSTTGGLNILAGSSTAFGIGASTDAHTLASLLAAERRTGQTWLNFGGRSFNAIQEFLLAALHYHRLPAHVERIIVLSGFNNLGLARQPTWNPDDHGTFFMWQRYQSITSPVQPSRLSRVRHPKISQHRGIPARHLDIDAQIGTAVLTTKRALKLWRAIAHSLGAELTFVLQPLANWVRPEPSSAERVIFSELDRLGRFTETYGDILTPDVHQHYSDGLAKAAKDTKVNYVDSVPLFANALAPEDWAYVDRIHFTDAGHEAFADILASVIEPRLPSQGR